MRILQSSLFRALSALVIGCLLIKYPDNTVNWITIAIGVLFLLSGIVSLLTYWNALRHVGEYTIYDAQGRIVAGTKPVFPFVGIGSIILGLILVLMPSQFVTALTYIIGIVLVLGALNLLMALVTARVFARLSLVFWLLPSIVLVVGIYFMVKPLEPASMTMSALGWLSLLYGVTEMVNALKLYRCRREFEKQSTQLQQFDEAIEVTETESE
jgi:uncharacterized membrane protein HdeD (DUF308 family)